jgi:hypothetical protein
MYARDRAATRRFGDFAEFPRDGLRHAASHPLARAQERERERERQRERETKRERERERETERVY